MLTLLLPLAAAHVPHDTVRALAVTDDGPWWLSAFYGSVELLARSDDRGLTWNLVGGPVMAEEPAGIASLDDGTVVVLTEQHLWWSSDGDTWESSPHPERMNLIRGGSTLVLAGPGGLWEGTPESLVQHITQSIASLGAVAVGDDGTVWLADWTEGPTWPGATVATTLGADVYVGDVEGRLHRYSDGAWTDCGSLPDAEHPQIMGLTTDGDLLLVATAWRTPFASGDACATWEDRSTGVDAEYDVSGGAHEEADAWPILTAIGDTWVAGGWAGMFVSRDQGATWIDAMVLPADFTRGVRWDSNFPVSGRIWVGSYAGAVGYTDDGGASFNFDAHGLYDEDVQRLEQLADPSKSNAIFAVSGWNAWASEDGGASWVARHAPTDEARVFLPMGDAGHYWALGRSSTGPDFLESTDAGKTWSTLTDLATAAAGAEGAGVLRIDENSICVSASQPSTLLCTADAGETWVSAAGEANSRRVSAPVGWPASTPTRVLWADDAGLHQADPLAANLVDTNPTGDDPPDRLVVTDDNTLLLATRAGALWRSLDGGATWEDLGLRLNSMVESFSPHPGFAASPLLLLGTVDGIFVVDLTATPALRRWGRLQRIDDFSGFIVMTGDCPDRVRVPDAAMDSLQAIPMGCSTNTWLRGDTIEVIGQSGGGVTQLWVDGGLVAEMADPDGDGVLARIDGLDDTWHRVELVGAIGDGVLLDALQARSPYDLLPVPEFDLAVPQAPDCGCGRTPSGGAWLLLASLLAARRGRSVGQPPVSASSTAASTAGS